MTEWKRHKGGAGWKVLDDGRIRLEPGVDLKMRTELDDDGCVRTVGEPETMRTLFEEHGELIASVARAFDLPAHWIAGMIAIEAVRKEHSLSFDPKSLRHEPGYETDETTPRKVSGGLMQTLFSTAIAMAKKNFDEISGTRDILIPPSAELTVADLFVPAISIALGTAYMRDRADKYGEDPILLVGAYNAGSLRKASKSRPNPWDIQTYGYTRIPKFSAFQNDYLATA